MGPYETLLDIEQSCKTNIVNIPRQIVTERDWLGIAFKCSGFNFVCPMADVSEVLRWPQLTELPSAQHWFKGTANLRGRILPITDLQAYVTEKPHHNKSLVRVMVICLENIYFGFAVEQVLGIERFFRDEIKPVDSLEHLQQYLPYLEGGYEREGKPWGIINFHKVVQSASFYHILSFRTDTA